ncbi:MAG: hypothetical protein QM669_00790 [Siphonobacter sp.]
MRYLFILFLLICGPLAIAQQLKFSEQPEQFAQDVQTASTAMGQAQTGTDFSTAWNSLSAEQKTQVISITKAMLAKNMRQPNYLITWFQAISGAVSTQALPATELSNLLTVTEKTFKNTDSKAYLNYLSFLRSFLANHQLYTSNYNKLFATNGSFHFAYADQAFEVGSAATLPAQEPKKAAEPAEPTDDGWGNGWDDTNWDTPVLASNQVVKAPPAPNVLAAGPILEVQGTTLALVTAQDSFTVANATFTIGIKEGLLYGKSGKYTWPLGDMDQANVEFTSYKMLLKNPRFMADEATLQYPSRLKEATKGSFRFESKKRPANAPVTQPQFQSDEANVELKGLGPDLEYRGGIALVGTKLYGAAANGQRATVTVKQNGKIAFQARSKGFELADTLLTSPAVAFCGYLPSGDSLTHPAIRLAFNTQTKQLRLSRLDRGGYKNTDFGDSYHGFSILADAMVWNLPSQRIEFDIISGQNDVPARFESVDYYNPVLYERLTSAQGFHPVTILVNCLKQQGVNAIKVDELAAHYQRNAKLMREALIPSIEQGFIDYNPDTDQVKVSKKGLHYQQSTLAKEDFDNLIMLSTQVGSGRDSVANATIDLNDSYLTIRGVSPFKVSDSLKIFIHPTDHIVKVGKNRSFVFNGEMKLDNFRFKGRNLTFNYEQFYVNLDKLDTVTFVPKKMRGKKDAKEIGEDLKYASGKLYLGKVNNKSGRKPSSPRLVVEGGANIYFDDTSRVAGIYNRKVYFKIPKIDQDSITSKDIEFAGTFYSDGILPPIQTTLISMPDNSLGFNYKVPVTGIKLYEGKGTLKADGTLKMDNQGLHADGNISLYTTSLDAKNLLLTPDSLVTTSGTEGHIREGTIGKAYFPEVALKNYEVRWLPKKDSLLIKDKGSSFDFYAGSSKLSGDLVVRASGLYGNGVMKRQDSEINSDVFQFKQNQFTAQRSQIRIGNIDKPVLIGKTVDVTFNTTAQNAIIQTPKEATLEDSSSLYFPYASYTTNINRADWDIAKKSINMKGNVKSSVFTSTNPDQAGLTFNGSEALYDIEKMTLNIKGVPYIKSADAMIIPDKGLVAIKQNAEMIPLKKARIIADTLNQFHHLSDGNIQILSAKKFDGEAIYQYVRQKGDTTKLKMDAFEFREIAGQTVKPGKKSKENTAANNVIYSTIAKAEIGEDKHFLLTPRLLFKGNATMNAADQGLRFNGAIQPNLKSKIAEPGWIAFKGNNGDSLSLKVDELKGEDNSTPLYVGLHFGGSGMYLSFLSPKDSPQDQDIFIANGLMRDDPKTNQLTIASDAKANDQMLEGAKYVLDDSKKVITYEGPMNLFYPTTIAQAAGYARIVPDSNKYTFNTMLVFNSALPAAALAAAADKIVKTNLDEKISEVAAEEDFDRLMLKIANLAGNKAAEAYSQKATNGANVPLPTISSKFAATAVLSNLSLRYNKDNQAFYSIGKIGVANIGVTDINSQFDGAVEIRKNPQGGDDMFIYLELSPDVWYYFAQVQGTLGVFSSDQDFNTQVQAKVTRNNVFMLASEEDKISFVDRFASMYRPRTTKPKPATRPAVNNPAPAVTQQTAEPVKTEEKNAEQAEEEKLADEPAQKSNSKTKKSTKKTTVAQLPKKVIDSDSTKTKPKISSLSETDETAPKKPAEKKTGF